MAWECAAYERHERLLDCDHPRAGVQVHVTTADGCSGRLCQDCAARIGVKSWPDLAERIAGPEQGLDVLQMFRALARRPAGR